MDSLHWNTATKCSGVNPLRFTNHADAICLYCCIGCTAMITSNTHSLKIWSKRILSLTLTSSKGPDEAKAFENSEYVKLHQSTLCKVDTISHIADRAAGSTLKTDAKLTGIYGNYFVFVMEKIKENWFFILLGIIGSVASITSWLRGR